MRTLSVIVAFALAFSASCDHIGSIEHTSFFSSHDAEKHFRSGAQENEYRVVGAGGAVALGGPTAEKEFRISLEGDLSLRDALVRQYKDYVHGQLAESNVVVTESAETGDAGFGFTYHNSEVTGLIRVLGTRNDADGYVEIHVFMYEHE